MAYTSNIWLHYGILRTRSGDDRCTIVFLTEIAKHARASNKGMSKSSPLRRVRVPSPCMVHAQHVLARIDNYIILCESFLMCKSNYLHMHDGSQAPSPITPQRVKRQLTNNWKFPRGARQRRNGGGPGGRCARRSVGAHPHFFVVGTCNPLNKSLHSHRYHSFYPEDVVSSFSGSNAPHSWQGTNIANPEYEHYECMRRAMEHAITSAHSTATHSPSATILILPRWEYTPYRHSKYITSPYTHHLNALSNDAYSFLPMDQHTSTPTPTPFCTRWMVDICLVASPLAMSSLPSFTTMTAFHNTLESI
jgi:hypothetical protein